METQEEVKRVAVLLRALEIMFEKLDDEQCRHCAIVKTCQGEKAECVAHHISEARRGG